MSLIKAIRAQLGMSASSAQNFVLDASAADGTMKLSRGNAGATTQDVMVVDGTGKVTFPSGSEMLGVGQTWQSVQAGRAIGTGYTNTTGRPILVSVTFFSSASTWACSINVSGLRVAHFQQNNANGQYATLQAIVPDGVTYSASGTGLALDSWHELR